MSWINLGVGRNVLLPDDDESKTLLPASVLDAMAAIRVAQARTSEVSADYRDREKIFARPTVPTRPPSPRPRRKAGP